MMTKKAFMDAYRAALLKRYGGGWAANAAQVDRFMQGVANTLMTDYATWNFQGPTTDDAWKAIGGKGKPTLTKLRALPND